MDELRAGRAFFDTAQQIIQGSEGDAAVIDARNLEDEIGRRGLWLEYIEALLNGIGYRGGIGYAGAWAILRATPEQRARAFLEAMKRAGDA